ncbi:histidine kinase N-terminal domain-containing protein [Massilibacterium senegalense]|uniref:histidine kinase N-terminal domain-containing protein n=1 Tax=Massilibacterium senegalense TaxID=1632858 RepID=UPI00078296BC|nr:histidine kinase N-terminal domain-containing protein [Massilibacterium senegalense]
MTEEKIMSPSSIERISTFLDDHIFYFLEEWLKVSKIIKDDPFYEEVKKNGIMTVRLVIKSLTGSYTNVVEKLMKKVANERIQANVNISEFVYNINVGRKIVIDKVLSEDSFSFDEKIYTILVTNRLFDDYAYLAVREYTKIKDQIILNKSLFIQEMHQDRLSLLGQLSAGFAHEFRNPLTAVKGFVQLLEQQVTDETTEKYFEIINRELDKLQGKINQFLYFSKIEGITEEKKSFQLEPAIKEMIDLLYPRIVEEKIVVTKQMEQDLYVCGVEEQLKQVILNILNNAVDELKMTKKQEKNIHITATSKDECVELCISNNGPQIPQHIIDNIFSPFVSTKQLGTGIGLSVCKKIIDLHDGRVEVYSSEEKTGFLIQLPRCREHEK